MKRLRSGRKKFRFEIAREEKALLLQILGLYPLVPSAHHRLSRGRQIPDQAENQELLEDSLDARRWENRQKVESLLGEPGRFVECPAGYRAGSAPILSRCFARRRSRELCPRKSWPGPL